MYKRSNWRGIKAIELALLSLCMCGLPAALYADISGTYDVGTLTPLQRPVEYGDNLFLSPDAAKGIARGMQAVMNRDAQDSDPDRGEPEKGGQVGGYNMFWMDPGSAANLVDGKFRTSILTHPKNGRIPAMTEKGRSRLEGLLAKWTIVWRDPDPTAARNTGTAWWLDEGDTGPYDNMEQRPLAERCIIGSRSTAGPPMLPNYYNNHKRIIQTDQHVMILTEMNHDARIVRINAKHRESAARSWLGDSIGHWEGKTLVVHTKNFSKTPPLSGANENLSVTERFSKREDGSLLYRFEVSNPDIWQESWAGEYLWQASDAKVYEYACHEGNHALGNIMRGARVLEADILGKG